MLDEMFESFTDWLVHAWMVIFAAALAVALGALVLGVILGVGAGLSWLIG